MKVRRIIAAACCVAVGAARAQTHTLSQTQSVDAHYPNLSTQLVFDSFDDGGGVRTLTSVTVTILLSTWGGYYAVDNDAASPASGTASMGVTAAVGSEDVRLPSGMSAQAVTSASFDLAANSGDTGAQYDAGGADWSSIAGPDYANRVTVAKSGTLIDSKRFDYVGSGSFILTFSSLQYDYYTAAGGTWSVSGPRSAEATVSVQYTYTGEEIVPVPVPEPTSLALGATGAAVLLAKLRRKRARRG